MLFKFTILTQIEEINNERLNVLYSQNSIMTFGLPQTIQNLINKLYLETIYLQSNSKNIKNRFIHDVKINFYYIFDN